MTSPQAQRIPPEAVRHPSRKPALMLPEPLRWCRLGGVAAGLACVVSLAAILSPSASASLRGGAVGGFFAFAGFAVACHLARRLPLQNVGAAFLVLWAAAFVGITLGVKSGLLFGRLEYHAAFGPKILGLVPWQLPFLYVALALASRETARLVLRPWRRARYYGLWLLATAMGLMLWVELLLQPWAAQGARWWSWDDATAGVHWCGVPWVVFAGTFLLAGGMLAFVGPWLISKRPVPSPPDYHPLGIWLLLACFCLIGDAVSGLWQAVGLGLAGMVVVVVLAVRVQRTLGEPLVGGAADAGPSVRPPPPVASA